MRVTQNAMTRQYINNTNKSLSTMNRINNRILTQRKFARASEDTTSAAKALVLRRNFTQIESQEANAKSAEEIFSSAETTLLNSTKVVVNITDSLVKVINSTNSSQEEEIIASQLENFANELLSQMNNDYADRKLFGGTNNTTSAFTYDKNTNTVSYNGVAVTDNDYSNYPNNNGIYVDIGIGIKYKTDGSVDPQSALNIGISGIDCLGYGTDEEGFSKNLIQLTFDAAAAVRSGDKEAMANYLDKINGAKSSVLNSITDLGNRQQTIEFCLTRLADDKLNIQSALTNVEGMTDSDIALELTNFKVAENAYNATLQMGSYVVPSSIFDFMK